MNTKLHAVADANGRPLSFFMTAGQVSDYTGAAALLDDLPKAQWLLGDRGYDADWFRDALQAKGIQPCIRARADDRATSRSDTTSAVTGVEAASRSCSAASRTGGALPNATIAAPRPSFPPSPSLPPSFSGCDQRVLTLEG
ncbi:transposase [Sphingomonas endophytica]|uniref:Transposase n=1 Tax=Sphingomonas endophytica TaxID=869719 RepID=A0ABR6N790_9SPHN|nr:transposase [Sphingomonas endophytica]